MIQKERASERVSLAQAARELGLAPQGVREYMKKGKLSQKQVLRYLNLVERRLYLVLHSGVDWIPEYEKELQTIDEEIASMRQMIDEIESNTSEGR